MKKKSVKQPKVLLCCSGGIDSSALICYYIEQNYSVSAIHFDYGHSAYQEEKRALNLVARHYHINVIHKKISPSISKEIANTGELIGRNALFVLSAMGFLEEGTRLISIGIHSGTPYYDCSPLFVDNMQSLLDGYYGGVVVFDVPFLSFKKSDIILWAREKEVPLDNTYSCQKGSKTPCGKCLSCVERKRYGL